ncbi:MAG: prepilin-type N-terminal cleavage/methylation domain-containing protein [Phycisphaerales bacterium]|nr:prepilin-type N-terminal cleavage/methylation domain-containing protein [Phycisphaerales bacterium]
MWIESSSGRMLPCRDMQIARTIKIRRSKYGLTAITKSASGFTLIELLVVIAIISLLLAILLPSLSAARKHGQAVKCATNLHHVAQAMGSYLSEGTGVYPPAYIYPFDFAGNFELQDQLAVNDHPFGYIHWSWFLYGGDQVAEEAFQCPTIPNGGTPRTNPGSRGWEQGQVDQNGGTGPSSGALQDKQAVRMAYGGNAAIFPRNKFQLGQVPGARINVFVNEKDIDDTARTMLATEFNQNWKVVSEGSEGSLLSKSHRPINVLQHPSTGSDEYAAPIGAPGYTYGNPNSDFGLRPSSVIDKANGLLSTSSLSEANAVGRHHPGGDKLGGTANFLYSDGHVERKTIRQTLETWEWGRRYYSISGYNKVGPPWK